MITKLPTKSQVTTYVRPIQREDSVGAYALLEELAKHEDLVQRFWMSLGDFESEIFKEGADWHALVAVDAKLDLVNKNLSLGDEATDNVVSSIEEGSTRRDLSQPIIGIATYCISNIKREFNPTYALYIDDLFVLPEYRKCGIAKSLILELKKVATARGLERMEWWASHDNEIANNVYEKLNAEIVSVNVWRMKI